MNECIEFGCAVHTTGVALSDVSAGIDMPIIFVALFVMLLVLTITATVKARA